MRIALGIVYLWFGSLKLFPNYSPAEQLAIDTINKLTFGILGDQFAILLLASMELAIGLFLVFNLFKKQVVLVALCHIACTFTPLFLFYDQSFNDSPMVLTLLGQYIVKNLVLASALFVILKEPDLIKEQ